MFSHRNLTFIATVYSCNNNVLNRHSTLNAPIKRYASLINKSMSMVSRYNPTMVGKLGLGRNTFLRFRPIQRLNPY